MRVLSHRNPETGARSFAVMVGELAITAEELRDAGGFDHTDALLDTYWLLESEGWHDRLKEAHTKAIRSGVKGRLASTFTPAAAIQTPEKIVCVGLNYRDHVAEGGREAPPRPLLFAKFANAVIADGEAIVHPAGTHALDFEAELGVVIGKRAKHVSAANAMDHVAGYVVTNDISARDWQGVKSALHEGEVGDGQWLRAKSSDTFLPMSAVLVTAEEVPYPDQLPIRGWLIPGSGPGAGHAGAHAGGLHLRDDLEDPRTHRVHHRRDHAGARRHHLDRDTVRRRRVSGSARLPPARRSDPGGGRRDRRHGQPGHQRGGGGGPPLSQDGGAPVQRSTRNAPAARSRRRCGRWSSHDRRPGPNSRMSRYRRRAPVNC